MFERSLLQPPPTHRWTTLASLTLQCSVAAAIIAIPLLHPASLVFRSDAPKLFLPSKPVAAPPPRVAAATAASSSTAPAASPAPAGHPLTLIGHTGPAAPDDAPSLNPLGQMGTGDLAIPGQLTGTGSSVAARVAVLPAKTSGPTRVSSGIVSGLLLSPIRPVYPSIAITTRTEGIVVVEAIISKAGTIESAHVVSGPAMLREAAIEAIQVARYSPFVLNGTPTEVQTTITVQFRLAS